MIKPSSVTAKREIRAFLKEIEGALLPTIKHKFEESLIRLKPYKSVPKCSQLTKFAEPQVNKRFLNAAQAAIED